MTRHAPSSLDSSRLAAIVAATVSCGDVVRSGRAPSFLVIDSLQGDPGRRDAVAPSGQR